MREIRPSRHMRIFDMPFLFKRVAKGIDFCIALLFVPLVILVRILRPFVLLRFSPIRSSRIGHFTGNIEVYLLERTLPGQRKTVDLFYHLKPVCNVQLKKMIEKKIHVFPFVVFLDRANKLLPGHEVHTAPIMRTVYDDKNLFAQTSPCLSFTPDEELRGRAILEELGVPENAKFICFASRDSAYLEAVFPRENWVYHDCRDSLINNYLPAVEELTRRGYYGIRMGAIVREPLVTNNPRIIDYSTIRRTDFMDIFLGAKTEMFLGDTSGIHDISKIFRKPILYTNLIPFNMANFKFFGPGSLFIPKKIVHRGTGHLLTFKEMLATADQFNTPAVDFSKQYEVLENTPQEILDLTVEWEDRANGVWVETEEERNLQERFKILCRVEDLFREKKIYIGSRFLKEHASLLT